MFEQHVEATTEKVLNSLQSFAEEKVVEEITSGVLLAQHLDLEIDREDIDQLLAEELTRGKLVDVEVQRVIEEQERATTELEEHDNWEPPKKCLL
jgi:hypothetical protein